MRDEIELLSAFSPKPQFALEGLCATSYGLDPRIMLALIGYTLGVIDTDIEASGFESVRKGLVREALSENLRKVLFIRERGMNFAGPRRSNSTFERLVCDHVVGRWHRTQERGSLHAKVILGIYKDDKGNRYGHLYVGSKNLTFSQCKEFGVVLELLPKQARKNPTFHGQLVSFFEDSLSKELVGASSLKTGVFNTVIRALKDFELAPSIPGLSFHWQSRHDRDSSLLPQLIQDAAAAVRIDIRSPWADPALFGRLSPVTKKTPLYVVCLKDPKYRYGKRDHLTVKFDGIAKNAEKLGQQQSHAKAYLFSGASTRTLMFGSANFTPSGIGISQTPNTEVLLRWPSDSKQFRALLFSGAGSDLDDAETKETPLTPQEILQQELFNIEIDVQYAYASAELQYNFRNLPDYKVKVTHLLLEPFAECQDREIVVVKAIPPESAAALKISPQNFKYFSSRVILSTTYKGEEVEADLCVELPADFYDARSNLRELAAFRLAGDQLIQELLNLADFPFPGGPGGGGNGIPPDDATLQVWAEKIHLERYLLRLFRMKKHDPALFAQRLKRLTNVIADLKASDEAQLKALGNTLGELKSVIAK